ncbi:MAG: hypothetical protein ACTSPD_19195 [Promethearchaeota archaeon]
MRTSRLFRFIVRFIILLLTIMMSIVSLLGGLSAVLILGNDENIVIPDGEISGNLSLNATANDNMSIEVPFKIVNAGFFDLTGLTINFVIRMEYEINFTHESFEYEIFNKETKFDDIEAGDTLEDSFIGDPEDFNVDDVIPDLPIINTTTVHYYADIILDAKYSIELLAFHVEINNFELDATNLGF